MRWNPFGFLKETDNYPYSRILRSSFGERVKDTFRILYGKTSRNKEKEYQIGIIDYILPFRMMLSEFSKHVQNLCNENISRGKLIRARLQKLACFGLFLPITALDILNLTICSILIIIATPIISIVHLFIKPKRDKLLDQIDRLKIHDKGYHKRMGSVPTLFLLKIRNEIQLKKIEVVPIYRPIFGTWINAKNYNINNLLYSLPTDRNLCIGLVDKFDNNKKPVLIKLTRENAEGVKALLKLNMFNATTNLKKSHARQHVEGIINFYL